MNGRIRAVALLVLLFGILAAGVCVLALADSNELVAARNALERRDFSVASSALEKHLARSPRDLDSRLLAVQTYRRRGDYREAVRHLQLFEEQGGPREAVQMERQLLAIQQGDLVESKWFLRFCEDNPGAVETPLVLEAVIVGTLNFLAAPFATHRPSATAEEVPLQLARRAIELWFQRPLGLVERVQGLVWRGRAKELSADHAGALADLRAALELNPDHYEARLDLALFVMFESPEQSLTHLDYLESRHPDDPFVPLAKANCLRNLGRLEEARNLLDRILASKPDQVSALLERGSIELDELRPAEAEVWFRRALAHSPGFPTIHQLLARSLQMQGRTEDAKRASTRAAELEAEQKQRLEKR